ncbi:hypothetical protein BUALT_Bualt12G0059200 [Buddleja alternifolia]|uniref:Ribulose bisphosphate carboxylase small subunit domain-containing protein n=1 Tax=Buddleja alternifolia TaxID=168488 RepID=A0AAV6WZE8_9LAMI|nr:hypothetical protein BUALT_Bualt12G0059200 [Buddleja alternifolia]
MLQPFYSKRDGVFSWSTKTVSNGSTKKCMQLLVRRKLLIITESENYNKKFETLSYVPPLSDESVAKEIDYMIKKGWMS